MKNEKLRLILLGVVLLLLISTFVLFSITILKKGQTTIGYGSIIIAAVILIFGVVFIKKNYREITKGHPLHDERSKKIMVNAGNKAFLISIWWILIIGWASSNEWVHFRDVSQATGVGILGMAIIFGLCWLWQSRKGDEDINKYY